MDNTTGPKQRPLALILDDEALLALEMEDLLRADGFDPVVACTEAAALGVPADTLSVAVVNLRLNGRLGGHGVIRNLRARHPNLPVVVVTGYDGTAPQANLRGLGWPTVRLHKPSHGDRLVDAVREVIARSLSGRHPPGHRRRSDGTDPTMT